MCSTPFPPGRWACISSPPTRPNPSRTRKKPQFNWKKLLPAPLLGFLIALVFLLVGVAPPSFVQSPLQYLGATVTPLSLLYIGITLADAGLKSIRFDHDTNAALIGRFVFAPLVMAALIFGGKSLLPLPVLETKTLIIQSAVPALAVLPILAGEAKGDTQYATNVVTVSTLLFVIVMPVLDTLLQGIG